MNKLKTVVSILLVLALVLLIAWCDNRPQTNGSASSSAPPPKKERPKAEHQRAPAIEKVGASNDETTWKEPGVGESLRARKTLKMTAVPTVSEYSTQATAEVSITVIEGADAWDAKEGAWKPMPQDQFERFLKSLGEGLDHHSATAMIIKEIDPKSHQPVIANRYAVGDGAKKPTTDYMETASGINITLKWNGDQLNVSWVSGGFKRAEENVVIPFSKRFQMQKPPSVPGVPRAHP